MRVMSVVGNDVWMAANEGDTCFQEEVLKKLRFAAA
jgi:hypothetical protein